MKKMTDGKRIKTRSVGTSLHGRRRERQEEETANTIVTTHRRQVCYGVMGAGIRGLFTAVAEDSPLRTHENAELAAVCDLRSRQLDRIRSAAGENVKLYTDVADFLQHPGLEAVYVATPDQAHYENALQVLRAGKHLLLEKPMARTTAHCDEMLRVWEGTGLVFEVFLELRFCNFFEKVKEILDTGVLGKLVLADVIDNIAPGGRYFFHKYFRRRETGISLVLQKGCHTLDLANWFIASSPRSVYAWNGLAKFGGDRPVGLHCSGCGEKTTCRDFVESQLVYNGTTMIQEDTCCFSPDVDMPDHTVALVEYDNGVKMFYQECHFTPEYTREFTFTGTEGKLFAGYGSSQDHITVQRRHSDRVERIEVPAAPGGHGGGDPGIIDDFLQCILTGATPRSSGLSARDSTALAMAIEESAAQKELIEIPRMRGGSPIA